MKSLFFFLGGDCFLLKQILEVEHPRETEIIHNAIGCIYIYIYLFISILKWTILRVCFLRYGHLLGCPRKLVKGQ